MTTGFIIVIGLLVSLAYAILIRLATDRSRSRHALRELREETDGAEKKGTEERLARSIDRSLRTTGAMFVVGLLVVASLTTFGPVPSMDVWQRTVFAALALTPFTIAAMHIFVTSRHAISTIRARQSSSRRKSL